jgi:hypothetical protein
MRVVVHDLSRSKENTKPLKGHKRSKPFSCLPMSKHCEYAEKTEHIPHKKYKEDLSFFSQKTTEGSKATPVGLLECNEKLDFPEKGKCVVEKDVALSANKEDSDTLDYIISRELIYTPDPYYLDKYQPDLYWKMRLILLDWLMEVSAEFLLKRETFHYSVNYIDRYLSLSPNLPKAKLQLLGTAALLLASKMEEVFIPKLQDFVQTTDNGYTLSQLQSMEETLVKVLKWELTPSTLNMWANWCMRKWDIYVQSNPYAKNWHKTRYVESNVTFKSRSEDSYRIFREVEQLIDIALLDIATLKYQSRTIAASSVYLILTLYYNHATLEEIIIQFPNQSFFLNQDFTFNELFSNFLKEEVELELSELLPTIQYMARFMMLEFDYTVPSKRYIQDVCD